MTLALGVHRKPRELPAGVTDELSLDFLRVVEQAAVAAARTMGQGDRHGSDRAAVEAMRAAMDTVPINGIVVIGEGERDEAPMLYIGERVGRAQGNGGSGESDVEVDIAVDPLEGTNLCATGVGGAIAVLAASERGGLLHAPDIYMEKLIVGPEAKEVVSLDAPVRDNLQAIADALHRSISDVVVVVLDRDRHQTLMAEIREAGARIKLIGDGDLSAGIAAAVGGSDVHAVIGIGGAPEGVLTAAAMRCLNGEIFARLVASKPEDEERCRAMGISDLRRVYRSRDLVPGDDVIFVATGVTEGSMMKGVRFFGDGTRTSSLIMQNRPRRVRLVDSIHIAAEGDIAVRF